MPMPRSLPIPDSAPELDFQVEGAEVARFAAVPTLAFRLCVESRSDRPIRSVAVTSQIRILPRQRSYTEEQQRRLTEIFGNAGRWGETLNSLLWTMASVQIPAFTGSTLVDLPVPCTYDFEVVSAKYFHTLGDGEIPLEFLFSGTVFYLGERGLQAAQISWDKECRYRLPARLWREVMERYFPNSAWLRLRLDTFDRLNDYKVRRGLSRWEDALERLLTAAEREEEAT